MSDATALPRSFNAGSTVAYTRSEPDYPASAGWTMTLYLAGAVVLGPYEAQPDGDDYTIVISAASTSNAPAGQYRWEERVAKDDLVYPVAAGTVKVYANIAAATAGSALTWAEKALAAVDARLEGRLTSDIESFSIAGRSVSHIPITELVKLRASLSAQVAAQRNPNVFGSQVRAVFTGERNET